MIKLDISNVWGSVEFADLMAIEKDVAAAHEALASPEGAYAGHVGWMRPSPGDAGELERLQTAADRVRSCSDAVVIVGVGGACLGARGAIELLQGQERNLFGGRRGSPRIFYAGSSLSTRQWNRLVQLLDGRDFSIVAVSKSGATTEPAIATRALGWMLERRYGTDAARQRILAVTDPVKGALRQMAQDAQWESFSIPADVGGRYSALTPAGLLPMAVAGLDIGALLRGGERAAADYDLRSYENPVWLYAAIRNLMHRCGKAFEVLSCFEPDFGALGAWWQQLFAESEGKQGKGLLPVAVPFTAGLHSLGQLLQQGRRNLFETMLRFDPPEQRCTIGSDVKNLDQLNYLAGKTLDQVDECAYLGAAAAHVDGGVPVISLDCGGLNEEGVGELIYFMELSCAVSAGILGVNPFNQPGVEEYRRNLFALLGRPGFENL